MVHLRLNEREANPNPLINFITALPWVPVEGQEEARQLLRALAAQVRPVMKARGFAINSLEEYEHNPVFAGRNWNNGETVELVLRRPDGSFMPTSWLLSTLCHELAHIKHMDHGPSFQALWKRLNAEVQALQRRGYYGDGYWSSGRRLADSAKVSGDGLDAGELPEFMCGGAQSRSRPSARRRGPSTPTSGKARKKHKPSTRVTSKRAFVGEGTVLSEENGKGTGFRKQAGSKRAREERAAAIERRLQLLKSEPKASSSSTANEESESDESDVEIIAETDLERRQALNASEKGEENLKQLRSGTLWDYFQNAFTFDTPPVAADGDEPVVCDVIELSDDDESVQMRSSSTTVNAGPSKPSTRGGKVHALTQTSSSKAPRASTASKPIKPEGRSKASPPSNVNSPPSTLSSHQPPSLSKIGDSDKWACPVCTLLNEPLHLVCAACDTTRGEGLLP